MTKIRKSYGQTITYKGKKIGKYGVWYPSGRFASQKFIGFRVTNNNNIQIASSSEFFGGINNFLRIVNKNNDTKKTFLNAMNESIKLKRTDLGFTTKQVI